VVLVHEDSEQEQPWIASVEELPGCTSRGSTPDEAAARIQGAISSWIEKARAEGRKVPEPKPLSTYSGRLLLRMQPALHGELTRAAAREKLSLNQLITDILSSAVGWQDPSASGPRSALAQEPGVEGLTTETMARRGRHARGSSRLVIVALLANFVVILAAALVGIAVLLTAWF
jgi:predicted RNase H-like HicB family nuclease